MHPIKKELIKQRWLESLVVTGKTKVSKVSEQNRKGQGLHP